MAVNERVLEALEYRLDEMAIEKTKVQLEVSKLTVEGVKIKVELAARMHNLEIEKARGLYLAEVERLKNQITAIHVYTEALDRKIDDLKTIHEDYKEDIKAIIEFLEIAKKEPMQPFEGLASA